MDWRTATVTCRVVEPDTEAVEAMIVEFPVVKAVARPELLTVATLPAEDVHIALFVMSCMVPSLKVPVAVNCCTDPTGSEGLAGVTAIEAMTAEVTVNTVLPVMEAEAADMVTLPTARVLANPVLSTVAIVISDELHIAPDMF